MAETITWVDQLTALGTVGAVVVSLGIAAYGGAVAARDKRSREAAERQLKEREHAAQFHWWHELCSEHPEPYDHLGLSTAGVFAALGLEKCWGETIVLENTSDAPVYDVVLYTPRYLLPRVTSFMPGEIGPRSRRVFHIAGFGSSLLDPKFYDAGRVTFVDSGGRRWQREKSGALSQTSVPAEVELRLAENMQWDLHATMSQVGAEYNWVDPSRFYIRDVTRTLVTTPSKVDAFARRYLWQQMHRADEVALRLLQELPPRHYGRRIAQHWWGWRSGSLSIESLLLQSALFGSTEANALLKMARSDNFAHDLRRYQGRRRIPGA